VGIFRRGLAKTRQSFFGRIAQIFGNTDITEDTWDELEAMLIQADMGLDTTQTVIEYLQEEVRNMGLTKTSQLEKLLKNSLLGLLDQKVPPLNIEGRALSIILIVGVNGSGKTTSIAKMANRLKKSGKKVMLAAGDTFRAAAIEQLQTWGQRVGVPVVSNKQGTDPAAVVYEAVQAALSQKMDGTTGQNALRQGIKFSESVKITGMVITKLDGTAKGGMIFSVFNDLDVPVYFIGLGEGVDDLVPFEAKDYVDSLFEEN
jgi:fused signal recognition particle receptor